MMSENRCPNCAKENNCAAVSGHDVTKCWCMSVMVSNKQKNEILKSVKTNQCLCRACLTGEDEMKPEKDNFYHA